MLKKITTLLFTSVLVFISFQSMTNGSGPPTSYSNAPSESNCTSCHSGSLISSGTNWNNITLTSNFTGGGYIPDSTYTINIKHTQSGISKFGFQATILDGSNKSAGKISGSGRVRIQSSSSLKRDYASHTSSGTSTTGTNSADWNITWVAPSTNIGPVKVYVTVNAANGDNTSSGDQIYGKVFTINPSSLLPVAKAKSNDTLACVKTDVQLLGTSTGNATSWIWSLPKGTPSSSTSQNPTVVYNGVGTFWAILTTKNSKGTSKSDSLKIIVNPQPAANISGPSSYALCKGDSVRLIASINPNYTYTWKPGGAVSGSIWAKDTGHYYVTTKDQNGCTNTGGPVVITHNPSHTLSISSDQKNDTVCFEHDINVTATGTTQFDSFLYIINSGISQRTTQNPLTLNLSGSSTVKVKGVDANGCRTPESNALDFVIKNQLFKPNATCSNKTTGGFDIEWSPVMDALGYEISLDTGKTWEVPSTGKTGLKHSVFGFPSNTDVLVQLRALDVFPCYQSPVTDIVCGSIPCSPLTYKINWDKDACKGSEINFEINGIGTNDYSLIVDNGNPFKDTIFTITADFSRTYKFELIDSSNLSCPTIKRDAAVTVWEIPTINLFSNNSQNIFCEGSSATFTAEAKKMESYEFFVNGNSMQKDTSSSWTYANPKNLDSVWVSIKNGACLTNSDKIKLGVKTLPTADFTHNRTGRTVEFTATETGTAQFIWDFGDGTTDSVNKNPVHDYSGTSLSNAIVKLKVIDEFGCEKSSTVDISIPLSVKNYVLNREIYLYPQPANQVLFVEIPAEILNSTYIVYDQKGALVREGDLVSVKNKIELTGLNGGIYFIRIVHPNGQFGSKILLNN